jgi:hypothetical protein
MCLNMVELRISLKADNGYAGVQHSPHNTKFKGLNPVNQRDRDREREREREREKEREKRKRERERAKERER